MLDIVKRRCYIMSNVFDDEIESLISAGITDCVQTGISKDAFKRQSNGKYDPQVLNCIVAFVKANRGNDRSDTDIYMKMYENYRDKMSFESDYNSTSNNEEASNV